MNTTDEYKNQSLMKRSRRGIRGALALLLLLPVAAWAGGVVTNCTESALRAAMAGGGLVTFAGNGTIVLAATITNELDTVLDGTGRQVIISGSNTCRAFFVKSNVNFTLLSLTIANGRSDKGAGIYNAGGQLLLQNCALLNNSAAGPGGLSGNSGTNGYGGAVYNLGSLNAINCAFLSNSVVGGAGGWPASFGVGGAGGQGNGGAIGNFGTSSMTGCWLAWNSATGGAGGDGVSTWTGGAGGDANGAAIVNFGTLIMTGCLLASNSATGGAGGIGGAGPYGIPGTPGGNGAPGGAGGGGNGGALFNYGSAFLVNNTLAMNLGAGGHGGAGGQGGPPGSQYQNSGSGGPGGGGGSGYGGVHDVNGQCSMTNCTLALNRATEGPGGPGGLPGPYPYPGTPHYGSPGGNGAAGPPGSGLNTAGACLFNTLLASNTPANGAGTITDAGHNLSSDGSCGFTGIGSLNDVDPDLGPLTDNGGPTLTMALLPGSPAVDAGSTSLAPLTDQRGFPRPAGLAADIGAFELCYPPILRISAPQAGTISIQPYGTNGQSCRLLSSTDLSSWVPMATNQIESEGTVLFYDSCAPGIACRYYRLVMP